VLPRTPNGKIDRNALPAPDLAEIAKTAYVAPANETEQRMAAIWEKILGLAKISAAANFFDIGGHSLLAAQLVARIEQSFGQKIPLAKLFQAPTIQQLSALLAGKTAPQGIAGLVALQAKGSRPPIFCLHGVPSMRLLAAELGEDQPFFVVNLPEDNTVKAPYRVEDIAAIHLETIQQIQPQGPYFLLGWCREALLAYEIAQRLRAQGQEVALVAMFDTWIPKFLTRFSGGEARRARRSFEIERLRLHGQNLRQLGFRETMTYTRERLLGAIGDRLRHLKWHVSHRLTLSLGSAAVRRKQSQDEMLLIAVSQYEPKAYDGKVILFRSDKYRTWKYWDRDLGWSQMLPNLQVHEVPGVHDSMLTGPNLPSIARAIAATVDDSVPQPSHI
jgi:thioesterase domain-containing protein/acyl carrier protein